MAASCWALLVLLLLSSPDCLGRHAAALLALCQKQAQKAVHWSGHEDWRGLRRCHASLHTMQGEFRQSLRTRGQEVLQLVAAQRVPSEHHVDAQ